MKAEAMPYVLVDTLAEIESKNILRDIGRYTDKGTLTRCTKA